MQLAQAIGLVLPSSCFCAQTKPSPASDASVLKMNTLSQSTVVLCIGMDEVLAHYACTFEISDLHFHFQ